jgi:hypothetical protein
MSFEPRDDLLHILAEADFLLEARLGLTFPEFDSDETLRFMGVDFELVWDVIQNRIPELRKQFGAVLRA